MSIMQEWELLLITYWICSAKQTKVTDKMLLFHIPMYINRNDAFYFSTIMSELHDYVFI